MVCLHVLSCEPAHRQNLQPYQQSFWISIRMKEKPAYAKTKAAHDNIKKFKYYCDVHEWFLWFFVSVL